MPAWALTISESAQSVTPSPYARQRPWRHVTSSGIGIGDARQLVHEAALPDSRHADEREQLRRSLVSCALEGIADDAELALAPDQFRARLVSDIDTEARVGRLRLPHYDRFRLPFRLDGLGVLVVDGGTRCPVRRLVDQHAVDGRGALEACSRVDDVAGGHALAGIRLCIELHERLARS